MYSTKKLAVFIVGLMLFSPILPMTVPAEIPRYQGGLTDIAGNPVADGS